jgi:hypothetical protein
MFDRTGWSFFVEAGYDFGVQSTECEKRHS